MPMPLVLCLSLTVRFYGYNIKFSLVNMKNSLMNVIRVYVLLVSLFISKQP